MQQALNKKSKIEAKLIGKTKIFGLETYKGIVEALKKRSSKVVPSSGGGKIKTRKYRNMNINKNTRKKNKCIKRNNTKKYIKRCNARHTRNKN